MIPENPAQKDRECQNAINTEMSLELTSHGIKEIKNWSNISMI